MYVKMRLHMSRVYFLSSCGRNEEEDAIKTDLKKISGREETNRSCGSGEQVVAESALS